MRFYFRTIKNDLYLITDNNNDKHIYWYYTYYYNLIIYLFKYDRDHWWSGDFVCSVENILLLVKIKSPNEFHIYSYSIFFVRLTLPPTAPHRCLFKNSYLFINPIPFNRSIR